MIFLKKENEYNNNSINLISKQKYFFLEKRFLLKKYTFLKKKLYIDKNFYFKIKKLKNFLNIKINHKFFFMKYFKNYKYFLKYFYICLKKTKSNFFRYMINYKNCFISLSIGQTGYKGPIKLSLDSYELLGYKFGFRLFKFYLFLLKRKIVMFLILLITFKVFKGLKKFLKKFLELGLKFFYIFIIYKLAHNGCRKKNAKRR